MIHTFFLFVGKSEAHFPTLLHFGARYGLKKMCLFLSENTLTRHASVQRNRNGYYPHEVAGHSGHTELAEELEKVFTQLIPGIYKNSRFAI